VHISIRKLNRRVQTIVNCSISNSNSRTLSSMALATHSRIKEGILVSNSSNKQLHMLRQCTMLNHRVILTLSHNRVLTTFSEQQTTSISKSLHSNYHPNLHLSNKMGVHCQTLVDSKCSARVNQQDLLLL
jgi:hypothetical protein